MELRRELRELGHLATPIVLGFLGNQLMGIVDTIMVGRLDAAAMGGTGIGGGIYMTLSLVAMGCAMGIDPLVTQAVGAGEHGRARQIYWHGVRVALAASVPIMALILVAPGLLGPLGVDPATAAACRAHLWGRVWNTVPLGLFGAARSYLQATGHMRAIVIATVVGNVANLFGDALLIYGDQALAWAGLPGIGLPALGVFGAGLASSLSALASTAILWQAVAAIEAPVDRRLDRDILGRVLALGLPVGLQMLVEVSAFATASALSGKIGQVAAAGNQIALSLASTTFMVPLGLGAATAVRVGQAVGRGDTPGARRAGLAGATLGTGFMVLAALAFLAAPQALARALTDKADVIAVAVPLVRVAALFQLFDGIQVVAAGALRGAGDTKSTFWANLVGHFVVGLPIAVLLAFGRGMGGAGLWWGLSAGLTTVAIALGARFLVISGRPIARIETR
jgi:MATE family multidrug resistance protein